MQVTTITELEWLKQTIKEQPKLKKDKKQVEEMFSKILEQEEAKLKE